MKKKLIIGSAGFVVMMMCTIISGYAYFTAVFEYDDISQMEITSAVLPTISVIGVDELNLNVTSLDMIENNVNTSYPVVVSYTSEATKIIATTSEVGGNSTIEYNIFYVPTVVFSKSLENTNNSKELVISIYSDLTDYDVLEFDLTGVSDKILIYNNSFDVAGINNVVTEVLDMELGFYNQDFNQTDNAGVTISGELVIEIVGVTYSTE